MSHAAPNAMEMPALRSTTVRLTFRQEQVLRFLADISGGKGRAPSLPEVQRGCGLARVEAVRAILDTLERRGYLTRAFGVPRSLSLTPAGYAYCDVHLKET